MLDDRLNRYSFTVIISGLLAPDWTKGTLGLLLNVNDSAQLLAPIGLMVYLGRQVEQGPHLRGFWILKVFGTGSTSIDLEPGTLD